MAVGQLLDYKRFIAEPHKLAVLLPEAPRPDLIDFLHSNSIVVITPTTEGRFDVAPVAKNARRSSAA
jgi:hypothetical protein